MEDPRCSLYLPYRWWFCYRDSFLAIAIAVGKNCRNARRAEGEKDSKIIIDLSSILYNDYIRICARYLRVFSDETDVSR